MTRSQPQPWFVRLAAATALLALLLTPAPHALHGPHASVDSSHHELAFGQDAGSEPASCPICAGLAQARTAIAPAGAEAVPLAALGLACFARVDDLDRPARPLSPASPRAPPAHV